MQLTVLRWVAVLAILALSIPLSLIAVGLGLVSIRHPLDKWIPFFEACFLTGFVSVVLAGMVAPKIKAFVKVMAMAVPLAYWLFEAREFYQTATRLEIFLLVFGITGGGFVAWYVLEHALGERGA